MELDNFLSRPLLAFVATRGPTVRPVWFLYEAGVFWWLTGGWARLPGVLAENPEVALVVVDWNLETGDIIQVHATGSGEIIDFDADRERRLLTRYLGPNRELWDERFRGTDPTVRFVRLRPDEIRIRDLSYSPGWLSGT
jgi:nitroimidazol reductase NimA-like FMN-containing flavoprotein (pyridoxamine 5'-phosphate oxidase superfamily)